MASNVKPTRQFERDFARAVEFLNCHTGGSAAAENLTGAIDKTIETLADLPEIRAVSRKEALTARGLREYFVRNYVILYRIEDETVYLVRLFHQSQQYGDDWYWDD